LKIDPAYIWQLSVGQQQRVEIIKALYRGADLLILDEPTAVLTPQEVNELFVIMRQMIKDGHALIFISHKLHEVVSISQRVSVLRDGRRIGTRQTSETTKQDLANWMVGREVGFAPDRGQVELVKPACLSRSLCRSDRGTRACSVSLELRSGGFWVSRLGKWRVARRGGHWTSQGHRRNGGAGARYHLLTPGERTERKLAYIPEERMRDGMIKNSPSPGI
jgi:simple sugar transport system ATP-binding protein